MIKRHFWTVAVLLAAMGGLGAGRIAAVADRSAGRRHGPLAVLPLARGAAGQAGRDAAPGAGAGPGRHQRRVADPAHPLHLDGPALEVGHRAGERHLLSAQGHAAGGRLAAGRLGARHARRGRHLRAVVGRPQAARRDLHPALAGERLRGRGDRLPGARRSGPASLSHVGGRGAVGARRRPRSPRGLSRQARAQGLRHRPVAGFGRRDRRHPHRADLCARRAVAGDRRDRRRLDLPDGPLQGAVDERSARRTTSRC